MPVSQPLVSTFSVASLQGNNAPPTTTKIDTVAQPVIPKATATIIPIQASNIAQQQPTITYQPQFVHNQPIMYAPQQQQQQFNPVQQFQPQMFQQAFAAPQAQQQPQQPMYYFYNNGHSAMPTQFVQQPQFIQSAQPTATPGGFMPINGGFIQPQPIMLQPQQQQQGQPIQLQPLSGVTNGQPIMLMNYQPTPTVIQQPFK